MDLSDGIGDDTLSNTSRPLKVEAGNVIVRLVVVHGLESKPEYSGRLGTIIGDLTSDGRYPVKVPNHPSNQQISIDWGFTSPQNKKRKRTILLCGTWERGLRILLPRLWHCNSSIQP